MITSLPKDKNSHVDNWIAKMSSIYWQLTNYTLISWVSFDFILIIKYVIIDH